MKAFDLKLNPGQRVVVVSGAYVIGNENNDKVEIHVLDGPVPVIDENYKWQVVAMGNATEGYNDLCKVPGATLKEWLSVIFRYSEPKPLDELDKLVDLVLRTESPDEYRIRVLDGAWIDENYDKDFFRLCLTMIKKP